MLHGFLDFSLTMFNNRVWRINNDVVDLQRVSEPIHETLNGDLKPCRFLRGIAQAHMVRFFSFLSPYATELRTGIREKSQQAKAAFASDRNSTAGSNRKRGTCWDCSQPRGKAKGGCRNRRTNRQPPSGSYRQHPAPKQRSDR